MCTSRTSLFMSTSAASAAPAAAAPAGTASSSAAPAAATAPPTLPYACVRVRASLAERLHLWNVLPEDESSKAYKKMNANAPNVVEQYRGHGLGAGRGALEVLRSYAWLGRKEGEHTEPSGRAFFAPLTGAVQATVGPKRHVHSVRIGCRRHAHDPNGLLGTYVLAAIGTGAGDAGQPFTYAVALAVGFDPKSSEYTVLHLPNDADRTVLRAQRALSAPKADAEAAATPAGASPETGGAADAADAADAGAGLRPRYYVVPRSRLAAYPGRSLLHQYVKGQEVLARWEARVQLTEPTPPNNLRPPKRYEARRWTSLLYPAEIVGGHGLEHVTVRYLRPDDDAEEVYTVHKLDVTLAPEKGEPDEAERKRQRKARKKRDEERKKRAEAKAEAAGGAEAKAEAAGGAEAKAEAAGGGAADAGVPRLPTTATTLLASAASVGWEVNDPSLRSVPRAPAPPASAPAPPASALPRPPPANERKRALDAAPPTHLQPQAKQPKLEAAAAGTSSGAGRGSGAALAASGAALPPAVKPEPVSGGAPAAGGGVGGGGGNGGNGGNGGDGGDGGGSGAGGGAAGGGGGRLGSGGGGVASGVAGRTTPPTGPPRAPSAASARRSPLPLDRARTPPPPSQPSKNALSVGSSGGGAAAAAAPAAAARPPSPPDLPGTVRTLCSFSHATATAPTAQPPPAAPPLDELRKWRAELNLSAPVPVRHAAAAYPSSAPKAPRLLLDAPSTASRHAITSSAAAAGAAAAAAAAASGGGRVHMNASVRFAMPAARVGKLAQARLQARANSSALWAAD